jgi:hypothetical protein
MDVTSQLPAPAAALSGGKLPARQAHDAASTPEPVLTEDLTLQPLVKRNCRNCPQRESGHSLTGFQLATKRIRSHSVTATHQTTRYQAILPDGQPARFATNSTQTSSNRKCLIYANKLE